MRVKPNECGHDDTRMLVALVMRFADAMLQRLLEKERDGRCGWADKEGLPDEAITRRLQRKMQEKPFDCVDVANYVAFLWNRQEEKEGP